MAFPRKGESLPLIPSKLRTTHLELVCRLIRDSLDVVAEGKAENNQGDKLANLESGEREIGFYM